VAALLSTSERQILEAAHHAQRGGVGPDRLTDVVRRTLGQVPGVEFRLVVARLAQRGLLHAQVKRKPGGEVGRVVIERITPLGRSVIKTPR
jgi:hypothetical protein